MTTHHYDVMSEFLIHNFDLISDRTFQSFSSIQLIWPQIWMNVVILFLPFWRKVVPWRRSCKRPPSWSRIHTSSVYNYHYKLNCNKQSETIRFFFLNIPFRWFSYCYQNWYLGSHRLSCRLHRKRNSKHFQRMDTFLFIILKNNWIIYLLGRRFRRKFGRLRKDKTKTK